MPAAYAYHFVQTVGCRAGFRRARESSFIVRLVAKNLFQRLHVQKAQRHPPFDWRMTARKDAPYPFVNTGLGARHYLRIIR